MFTNILWRYTFSVFLGDANSNNTHVSKDSWTPCQLVPPFIINKHIHPFEICDPKYQCYLNSVIQAHLPILRIFSHNFHFISSTEGPSQKCLRTPTSNSADVGVLKFRLAQYDMFYNGQIQKYVSKRFFMPIEVINKGSIPYCDFTDKNSAGVSLCDILFSFMWENILSVNLWTKISLILV